jgi:hypothetical protein
MPASTAVTQGGRGIITSRLIGTATAVPHHIGWGTGTTAVLTTDTALQTEDTGGSPAYARATGADTQTTTTTASDTHTVIGTLTSNGTKTITEAGLFTAATSGTLYVRGVLATAITVAVNDSVAFTFNVQISSSVV